jgi:sugar lactone lactonase YvrE
MANRLVRLTPVTTTTATDSGAAFNKTNVQPISNVGDLAGVCIDRSEYIYVTDYSKHVVHRYRKGDSASKIFAGTYNVSGTTDGIPGTGKLYRPTAIAVDPSGNLYVIDSGNALIRRIDTNGRIYTVASIPAASAEHGGIAVDASGNIYFVDDQA